MTRRGTMAILRTFAIVVLAVSVAPQPVPAQKAAPAKKESPPPPYNPYPTGILPADLDSEIERVSREVRLIFQQALAEWRALPPPNLTGQATANAAGQRLRHGSNARQADELRREHVRFQESGLRVLSHAVRGVQRTDPVRQPDDGRVSRIVSFPGRQANRAAIHVRPLVPRTPVQRNPSPLLWRKLLGLTGDRIPVTES